VRPATVWRMIILEDLGEKPEQLTELVSAGEPLNPEVIDAVKRAWGLTIRDGFGQAETTCEGGYYRTGDEARVDAEGYFHYVGRVADVFKSSDYRISPFELERALLEHEAVAEAAIIPSPDPLRPRLGRLLRARVVDRLAQLGALRRHAAGERSDHLAVLAHQVLVEVPLRLAVLGSEKRIDRRLAGS
jgi:acyl-coenzyme A synthetase/AMP-(fatty) acid ligase